VHDAATAAGLTCLGYGAQSAFLLGCGLAELFSQRVSAADPAERIRAAHALQLLVSEAEMGELFKVIALGSDPACEPLLLDGRDRRAVLIA
jgi:SAM-dependent MidA family methyltransferase